MSADPLDPPAPVVNDCGHATMLHVVIDNRRLCAACWRRSGATFPTFRETGEQAAARMDAINRKNLAQGGAAAHMVRSGKT